MYKQFDIVTISTTKRIRFLSGPPNSAANPQGQWSIIGFVGSEAVLAKESTIVRVPLTDIKPVARYNLDQFLQKLYRTGI